MTREQQAGEAYHYLRTAIVGHCSSSETTEGCLKALNLMFDLKTPAASKHHHNYEYGLIIHTAEVYQNMCFMQSGLGTSSVRFGLKLPSPSREMTLICALFHDLAKTKEYEIVNGEIVVTPYYSQIGHIVGSTHMLKDYMGDTPVAEEIIHAMLAHHGQKAWGSPVEPQTPLAWILHLADMMSAKAGPTR